MFFIVSVFLLTIKSEAGQRCAQGVAMEDARLETEGGLALCLRGFANTVTRHCKERAATLFSVLSYEDDTSRFAQGSLALGLRLTSRKH